MKLYKTPFGKKGHARGYWFNGYLNRSWTACGSYHLMDSDLQLVTEDMPVCKRCLASVAKWAKDEEYLAAKGDKG